MTPTHTTPKNRLVLLLALLAALLLGAPGTAKADDHDDASRGGNTNAIAINTKDGSSLFKFAFAIKRVAGDVVDNQNAAVAYASCENCRTTAISIQIVLVSGSPSTVVPENYAISINENCTLCQTFTAAFQFVIGVDDPSVGFTKEGKRELRRILREFKALEDEQLTPAEFDARAKALAGRLRTVLKTQLVSRRDKDDEDDEPEVEDEEVEEVDTVEEEEDRPAPPAAGTTTEGTTSAPPPATTETTPTTTETEPAQTEPPPPTTTGP
jgi:putative peptide zinc metalloprotease protein